MPYIIPEQRVLIDKAIEELREALVKTQLDDETATDEGMLNYAITRILMTVYGQRESTRYSLINNAVGMLECCKLEFYRQVAAPYEDQKIHDNGAVELNESASDDVIAPIVVTDVEDIEDIPGDEEPQPTFSVVHTGDSHNYGAEFDLMMYGRDIGRVFYHKKTQALVFGDEVLADHTFTDEDRNQIRHLCIKSC